MKLPREYFYIFYTVSIMKSMGMRIKPKREYFCYAEHRIQFALKEVLGLKRCDENFSSVCDRERAHSSSYPCGPSLAIMVPGCTFLAVPYINSSSLGITVLGTVDSLSLCRCAHVCYGTPDFILTLAIRSLYTQLGRYRRLLPAKRSLETSSAQKLILHDVMGSDGTTGTLHFRFLDQEFSTDSCLRQPAPVILWSLRRYRDDYCFYLT